VAAYKWLSLACQIASSADWEKAKTDIEGEMSAEQISEAKRLANKWWSSQK